MPKRTFFADAVQDTAASDIDQVMTTFADAMLQRMDDKDAGADDTFAQEPGMLVRKIVKNLAELMLDIECGTVPDTAAVDIANLAMILQETMVRRTADDEPVD